MSTRQLQRSRGGFVLISVLVVLLALLVLTAPFLATARNASSAGAQAADRAEARLGLASASRHARAHLSGSHPAFDETPWADGPDELSVPRTLPEEFPIRTTAGPCGPRRVGRVRRIDLDSEPVRHREPDRPRGASRPVGPAARTWCP